MAQNEQLGRKKRAQYAGIVAGVMPMLLRRARRLLRDDDEAWDLVQTTLERGYRSFDSFVDVLPERDGRLTRAEAWLFTIMNNHFIDLTRLAWKRRRRMPVHLLEAIAADPPSEQPPIWVDLPLPTYGEPAAACQTGFATSSSSSRSRSARSERSRPGSGFRTERCALVWRVPEVGSKSCYWRNDAGLLSRSRSH